MEHAIEIRNLSVRLPGFALSDIDMDIPKGCVTGDVRQGYLRMGSTAQ